MHNSTSSINLQVFYFVVQETYIPIYEFFFLDFGSENIYNELYESNNRQQTERRKLEKGKER